MPGFSLILLGRFFFILERSRDDNLRGSIIDSIIAEEKDPASRYFG